MLWFVCFPLTEVLAFSQNPGFKCVSLKSAVGDMTYRHYLFKGTKLMPRANASRQVFDLFSFRSCALTTCRAPRFANT